MRRTRWWRDKPAAFGPAALGQTPYPAALEGG
jgi:hypothetical protein